MRASVLFDHVNHLHTLSRHEELGTGKAGLVFPHLPIATMQLYICVCVCADMCVQSVHTSVQAAHVCIQSVGMCLELARGCRREQNPKPGANPVAKPAAKPAATPKPAGGAVRSLGGLEH